MSTYGPTPLHQKSMALAEKMSLEIEARITSLQNDKIKPLEQKLKASRCSLHTRARHRINNPNPLLKQTGRGFLISTVMIFRNIHGTSIDPISYTKAMVAKYPYATIHVGTDSQSIAQSEHSMLP